MITLLTRFLKKWIVPDTAGQRSFFGMLCGAVGIFLNMVLFAAKLASGLISGSVAIVADGFNNLSDAGSSVISLIGFKLAERKPDLTHPFGHGRFEYLSGLAVSALIILMGVELAKTSVDKILSPQPVTASAMTIVILIGSIAVKCYMFLYNSRIGKRLDSATLRATGIDSLSDCIATGVVLAATLASRFTTLPIDGYCGILVSLMILFAGISAAKETLDPLLGAPPSKQLVQDIEQIVMQHPEIIGMHDLIVHDYGPCRKMISLHAEVPEDGNMLVLHDIIDNLENELRTRLICDAVIHMDPISTQDEETVNLRTQIAQIVAQIDPEMNVHDFRMVKGPTHTNLIFDLVRPYSYKKSDDALLKTVNQAILALGKQYRTVIHIDDSYTALDL